MCRMCAGPVSLETQDWILYNFVSEKIVAFTIENNICIIILHFYFRRTWRNYHFVLRYSSFNSSISLYNKASLMQYFWRKGERNIRLATGIGNDYQLPKKNLDTSIIALIPVRSSWDLNLSSTPSWSKSDLLSFVCKIVLVEDQLAILNKCFR